MVDNGADAQVGLGDVEIVIWVPVHVKLAARSNALLCAELSDPLAVPMPYVSLYGPLRSFSDTGRMNEL